MSIANPSFHSDDSDDASTTSVEDCFGANLNSYRRLGLVGQGQFAQVYCAAHCSTGQIVALKQMRHARVSASQEAKILPKLHHHNVVGCYAVERIARRTTKHTAERTVDGTVDGTCDEGACFVLEYCESGTLRNYLSSFNPLPFFQAKSFLVDLLSGLDYIHKRKILHGDLKPENILLTYQSKRLVAKLSDFGSACATDTTNQSQLEIGSPTYAAPERFDGHASYATDLYSVGVMLYELLIGDRPFSGSPYQLQIAHKEQPVSLPNNLTNPATQLIKASLQKDPDKRFKSASAMLSAIQQLSTLYQSATPQLSRCFDTSAAIAHASIDQAIASIPFSSPVESIVSLSNGCCLKTASSLYLINTKRQRSLLTPAAKSAQVAISPDCRWLITFDENSPTYSSEYQIGEFYKIKDDKVDSDYSRSVVLNKYRSRETILKILALDNRYLLRIGVDRERNTTALDCFTRRGQFIGEYKLDFVLSQVAIAPAAYQLIACIEGNSELNPRVAIISLKPFQVRYLPCASSPRCACATSWGYVVVCPRNLYFFDRDSNLIGQLEHALEISAIAPLSNQQILLSTPQAKPHLQLLELSQLEIDIIF